MPRALGNDAGGPPSSAFGLGRGSRLALALLFLGLSWLYVTHPAGGFTAGGQVHGDGVYYYAYTRSLVFDRDVDFANDYALLGDPHQHGNRSTGYADNRFAAGAGILWIPTFVVAHGIVSTGTAIGWLEDPCDGTSRLHQRITLFGSVLWGFAAVVLAIRLASRYVPSPFAVAAGLAIALASPLGWYMVFQPSWPHATNAFVVAAFVWHWHEGRRARSHWGWARLGALAGLMVLVRTQDVVFLVLPAFDLGAGLGRALRERNALAMRRQGIAAALLLGAAALCFAPQLWTWASIHGDPLVIPQGSAFMRWGDSKWLETLFSSRNGLFAWTPLVGVSVLGLLVLGIRRADARNLVGLLLLTFFLQAYVNGSVDDWWGGWAFGGRRFLGCTVLFVLGGAHVFHSLHRFTLARQRLVATGGLVGFIAIFVSYNTSIMWDYWHAQVERGQSQAMEPVTQRWASRIISGWYTLLGHPGAVPANLLHAWEAGVSPGHYDATSGWELATDRGQLRGWDRVSFPDPRWAGAGFGPRQAVAGLDASWVEDEAIFVVPVRRSADLHAVLLLRPARPETHVRIEIGGHPIFDRSLAMGWNWYRTIIPADALEAGLNYARVTQLLPGPGERIVRPVGLTGHHTAVELEVISDLEAEAPLRFAVDRTTIDVVEHGMTAFAIDDEPGADGPGYRSLGTFDTARDVHAAQRLAQAIERLPPDRVVVLGLSGSGLHRWAPPADAAIAALGGQAQLDGHSDDTRYALIGVRGAPPGTALEILTHEGPAVVTVGRPTALRHEGVAWGKLTVWRLDIEIPHVIADRELLPAMLAQEPEGTRP